MVLAHVVDAWTRDADRDRTGLLLDDLRRRAGRAGVPVPRRARHGAVGRRRSGGPAPPRLEATLALARRGWIIFGLAFVFRLQSLALGWGSPIDFLKVDILNVMGLALVAAALLWGAGATARGQVLAASAATVALAMAAPLIRTAAWIDAAAGAAAVVLAADAGPHQLHAGAVGGLRLRRRGRRRGARRAQHRARRSAGCSAALAVLAAGGRRRRLVGVVPTDHLSARPLDVLGRLADVLLPAAGDRRPCSCRWRGACGGTCRARSATTLATIGAASLFAYWVHVELVYGGIAIPIKRRVPLELALLAAVAIAYGLARLVPRARAWVADARSAAGRGARGWSRGCCDASAEPARQRLAMCDRDGPEAG